VRFGPAEAGIKALAEQEANRSIAAALAVAPVGVSDPSDLTGYGVPDPAIVWCSQHRSAILEAAAIPANILADSIRAKLSTLTITASEPMSLIAVPPQGIDDLRQHEEHPGIRPHRRTYAWGPMQRCGPWKYELFRGASGRSGVNSGLTRFPARRMPSGPLLTTSKNSPTSGGWTSSRQQANILWVGYGFRRWAAFRCMRDAPSLNMPRAVTAKCPRR